MLSLTSEDGTVFMVKSEDAHTVFPNLSHELATAVNTLYGQKINDVDADAMGVRFLSRATDNRFLGADKDAAAATIESAARIAFAGAVPQMTKMASDAGSNAVVNRLASPIRLTARRPWMPKARSWIATPPASPSGSRPVAEPARLGHGSRQP